MELWLQKFQQKRMYPFYDSSCRLPQSDLDWNGLGHGVYLLTSSHGQGSAWPQTHSLSLRMEPYTWDQSSIESPVDARVVAVGRWERLWGATDIHCPVTAPQHLQATCPMGAIIQIAEELWTPGLSGKSILIKIPHALFSICFVLIRDKENEALRQAFSRQLNRKNAFMFQQSPQVLILTKSMLKCISNTTLSSGLL